ERAARGARACAAAGDRDRGPAAPRVRSGRGGDQGVPALLGPGRVRPCRGCGAHAHGCHAPRPGARADRRAAASPRRSGPEAPAARDRHSAVPQGRAVDPATNQASLRERALSTAGSVTAAVADPDSEPRALPEMRNRTRVACGVDIIRATTPVYDG